MLQRVRNRSALLCLGALAACSSSPDLESFLRAFPAETPDQEWHVGPGVHISEAGTARFVTPLYEAFDLERTMETVRFVDRFYRAPANEGYDEVIDHLLGALEEAGFGGMDDRLLLEVIEEDPISAWTPRSGSLTLLADGEKPRTLHAFDTSEGVDRVMLPVYTPSCDVQGVVATELDELKAGMILVTDVSATQVLRRARSRGAAAVISASLADFNTDPSGQKRHEDAIQFRTLQSTNSMPVAQISPKSLLAIEAAVARAAVRNRTVSLRFQAEVELEQRPMRTVVATILGDERPEEAVAMVSHVQEPGACDNATGVAGLLEGAVGLTEILERGELSWPDGSLVFIWGDEFSQSEVWLEHTDMTPVAGISSDMTGQSRDTGAIALLERMPDPGAVLPLPPDAHTPWGAGNVDADHLVPSGFAVIARCAMVDVGIVDGGEWPCADHPWEGGSDHDVFIARDIPAVLFWHFTDFTYHTSLDRMGFVDAKEIRRTTAAILATALGVSNARPEDLERYLKSLDLERDLRIEAAREEENLEIEMAWALWCDGARNWLRKLCLRIDEDLPAEDR
jgi:hypothetical protein